eukprot:scpid98684/ scgid35191/ 
MCHRAARSNSEMTMYVSRYPRPHTALAIFLPIAILSMARRSGRITSFTYVRVDFLVNTATSVPVSRPDAARSSPATFAGQLSSLVEQQHLRHRRCFPLLQLNRRPFHTWPAP